MTRDVLLFHSRVDNPQPWQEALAREMPELEFRVSPDIGNPEEVRYALFWNPPEGFFQSLPNLELIVNLGAGVDGILARNDLPAVPISRISDPEMSRMMASYVVFAVLRHYREIPRFERAQRAGHWDFVTPRLPGDVTVGIMGLGELGAAAAGELVRWGFDVRGWARSRKQIEGVTCYAGDDDLDAFLRDLEIVVVMLPLTPRTRDMIDSDLIARLPRGVKFINVARGDLVDEDAMIEALRTGHISEATLDVFRTEPLPPDSPLWKMDQVLITPHLASIAIPSSAAAQIAESIRRVRSGKAPLHQVDPGRGY